MGIAGLPDIFQKKMTDLMATLEFVRTYLDDLLIITKRSLVDHLEKLSMVLTRLQDASLKINADKSNFCTLEMNTWGIYSQEMVSNHSRTRYKRCLH